MKQLIISVLVCLILTSTYGQGLVKRGDNAPDYQFTKLVNAPQKEISVSALKGKPFAIAFWGTWCSPCVPEMVNLGKLQKQFGNKVQIIGVSNDNEEKLKYFLQKHPSNLWFASDPSNNLWRIFGIQIAGHIVLVNKDNTIVSITETRLVDSVAIQKLIDKKPIGLLENKGLQSLSKNEDPFKLDSSTIYSFVLQPQLNGIAPMMKRPNNGAFNNRRITIINLSPSIILMEAFGISVPKKIVYATKEDSILSLATPVCLDLIVSDKDKPNLNALFQKELNSHLPVKGEIQKRIISCYVLKPIKGKQLSIKETIDSSNTYSYNGLEFYGRGIPIKTFVNYMENELMFPVYDATGLTKYYDIDFSKNNVEPLQSIKTSLAKLGLELEKDQKEMEVLVISSR